MKPVKRISSFAKGEASNLDCKFRNGLEIERTSFPPLKSRFSIFFHRQRGFERSA